MSLIFFPLPLLACFTTMMYDDVNSQKKNDEKKCNIKKKK